MFIERSLNPQLYLLTETWKGALQTNVLQPMLPNAGLKVAKNYAKVAKNVATADLLKKWCFQNTITELPNKKSPNQDLSYL